MVRGIIIILGLLLVGCNTTHKLTGTDYVDLEIESAPAESDEFPEEIVRDAGWDDIRSDLKQKDKYEELRLWLTSDLYPSHIFKITKKRKNVEGAAILYWPRDTIRTDHGTVYLQPRMMQMLEGGCTSFHEAGEYGYCIPEFKEKLDWENVYQRFESVDFWQIQGSKNEPGNSMEENEKSKNWHVFAQMRLGNYYREYDHKNPHTYANDTLSNRVNQLSREAERISESFEQPIPTSTFQGVTNGVKFVRCDSLETWQLQNNLAELLTSSGLQAIVDVEGASNLYYLMLKGWVRQNWYHEWVKLDYDRNLYANEMYDIRTVKDFKCPDVLSEK